MRSHTFHRRMSSLGLVAALLLALMPTIGRLTRESGNAPVWEALCTAAGLVYAPSADSSLDESDAAVPAHPSHAGDDCAYCPLLGALALLVVAILLASAHDGCRRVHARGYAPARKRLHPCGLGSRGPPLRIA